jgi:hypothetical protein
MMHTFSPIPSHTSASYHVCIVLDGRMGGLEQFTLFITIHAKESGGGARKPSPVDNTRSTLPPLAILTAHISMIDWMLFLLSVCMCVDYSPLSTLWPVGCCFCASRQRNGRTALRTVLRHALKRARARGLKRARQARSKFWPRARSTRDVKAAKKRTFPRDLNLCIDRGLQCS